MARSEARREAPNLRRGRPALARGTGREARPALRRDDHQVVPGTPGGPSPDRDRRGHGIGAPQANGPLLYQHDHGIAITREAADEIEHLRAIAHDKQMVEAEREELRYQVERLQAESAEWRQIDAEQAVTIDRLQGIINAAFDIYDADTSVDPATTARLMWEKLGEGVCEDSPPTEVT